MPRPQHPGNYIRIALTHPVEIGPYGPSQQRTLRLSDDHPEAVIQELADGALLVFAEHGRGGVETFHFPARSISHWSTYTITQESFDALAATLEEIHRERLS